MSWLPGSTALGTFAASRIARYCEARSHCTVAVSTPTMSPRCATNAMFSGSWLSAIHCACCRMMSVFADVLT